ncbi:MAG: 3-deoxy-D-manno-octulosonic acid transferase [Thiohalospira sp.]
MIRGWHHLVRMPGRPFRLGRHLAGLTGRHRGAHRQRLGLAAGLPEQPYWFHAEQAGDLGLVEPVIRALREAERGATFLVTTGEATAVARAEALFEDEEEGAAVLAPDDDPGPVRRFLRRADPLAALFAGLPDRPELLFAAADAGLAPLIVDPGDPPPGRRRALRAALGESGGVWVADTETAEAFAELAPEGEARVIGDLRLDAPPPTAQQIQKAEELRETWGPARPVWLALATEPGEEQAVFEVFQGLRGRWHNLLLALAPRDPGRAGEAIAPALDAGYRVYHRSRGGEPRIDTDVYLEDRPHDWPLACHTADLVFIGGTLHHGGNNPAPAAAAGRALLSGRSLDAIMPAAAALHDAGALLVVGGRDYLEEGATTLLADKERRHTMGEAARAVAAPHAGAVAAVVDTLRATADDR